jgi:hypothetical protein
MRPSAWRLTFRFGLLAYLAIISFLAFAPLTSDPGTGNDKANHLLAFVVLAWLADCAYPGRSLNRSWGKWAAILGFGLFIEAVQFFLPYREFSGWDLAVDGGGVLLYVAGTWLVTSPRAGQTRLWIRSARPRRGG